MAENKMEAYVRKDKDREWIEEKKLELRLGPPDGDFDWNKKESSYNGYNFSNPISGNKRDFGSAIKDHVFSPPWSSPPPPPSFSNGGVKNSSLKQESLMLHHHLQQPSCFKESSQLCSSSVNLQAFSPPATAANTAVSNANIGQKRTAPAPVVGWPPVRSFRRNIASSSNLNPNHVAQNKICKEKVVEINEKGIFVKINMEGVPIGRKVDLKVYDSYEKLSFAVDDLFRGLLAAQNGELSACGSKIKEEEKVISGVLDGSGEYALVYEDNEGDRMLVGDVPWQMFISTVKRLRVLKTADISSLCKKKEVIS